MSSVSKANSRLNNPSKKAVSGVGAQNKPSKAEGSTASRIKQNNPPVDCAICSKRQVDPKHPISLGCGHKICNICCELVGPTESKLKKKNCPECVANHIKPVVVGAVDSEAKHTDTDDGTDGVAGGAVWDEASPSSSDVEPDEMERRPSNNKDSGQKQGSPINLQPSVSGKSLGCPSSDSHEVCGTHGLEFTGFCMSCRKLTCVDCLYTDHKSHDFHPIKQARQLAAGILTRHKIQAEGVREEVANRLTRVRTQVSEADDLEAAKLAQMKSIMNQIKRQIQLREKKLEESIKSEFQIYKQKAQTDLGSAQKELVKIDTAVSSAKHLEILDDTRFLGRQLW